MLPSFSVSLSAMDLRDTNIREKYCVSQQPIMQFQEIVEARSNIKDLELSNFGVLSSQGDNFLQDSLHIDPFQAYGSSSNPVITTGFQTANSINSFDSFSFGCSSSAAFDFDVYESKPFTVGNKVIMENNFRFGGNNYGFNFVSNHERNRMEMADADQLMSNYLPFDSQQTTNKSMNFLVSEDEVSIISADHSFLRRVGLNNNKNRRLSSTSMRRARKVPNKPNVVKGQWTVKEDRLLIQLVEQCGVRKWSHIAQRLPGRIGKQCRERWHNHLRPNIKKDTWSNEEDKILIEAHIEIGNKWAEIAKKLPGRTENSIKNHWNATKRRQYSRRKCRSKYPKPSLLQEYIKSLNLDKNPPLDYRKRASSNSANPNNNNPTTGATIRKASSEQFCPDNDMLVPTHDFNDVPEFCFYENTALFQEECNLDSLLDDMMTCDSLRGEGDFEAKLQFCGVDQFDSGKSQNDDEEVGVKEMDLLEMMMPEIKDVLL